MDQERTLAEAEALNARFPPEAAAALFGVSRRHQGLLRRRGLPDHLRLPFLCGEESASRAPTHTVAARLRQAGAVIMGKTHLHQLAYGITGENSEYGDCLQPRDPLRLTGGSSSGSAASVQEGSAVAAIGTDTGGSIRVPAALCGLAGYRSTLGLGGEEAWEGGWHLAVSFDTLGWLFRDLRDGPALAAALLGVKPVAAPQGRHHRRRRRVFSARLRTGGARDVRRLAGSATPSWRPARGVRARFLGRTRGRSSCGIQGHEASELHRGNFEHFEKPIAERLAWGASLSAATVEDLRKRQAAFRDADGSSARAV